MTSLSPSTDKQCNTKAHRGETIVSISFFAYRVATITQEPYRALNQTILSHRIFRLYWLNLDRPLHAIPNGYGSLCPVYHAAGLYCIDRSACPFCQPPQPRDHWPANILRLGRALSCHGWSIFGPPPVATKFARRPCARLWARLGVSAGYLSINGSLRCVTAGRRQLRRCELDATGNQYSRLDSSSVCRLVGNQCLAGNSLEIVL